MQFVLLKSNKKLDDSLRNNIKNSFKDNTSVVCPHKEYEWINPSQNTFFIGRNPNLPIYKKYNTFYVDEKNNLSFIHGWLKNDDEDYLLNSKSLKSINNENKLDGFFVASLIDYNGNGEFYCSSICPHLYYAKSKDFFAISNRISILSSIFNYNQPNKKHIASHIQFQHDPITYDTMYENIYWIPYGTKIIIKNFNLELKENYNFLHDECLHKKYENDKESYWDEFYEKVISQVKSFINLKINDKLTLGLSGGVDSRLILSLYYEYINEGNLFSWGPAYSPEVIVGRMVADSLNMHHSTPSLRNVSNSINLLQKLPQHLFAREFEMCPWDFGWLKENMDLNIKLDGQEFIRTTPYINSSIEKILDESNKKYSNIYAISNEFERKIINENNYYTIKFLENIDDINKFPLIKRMYNRGRWASRVHETIFDHSFHIYPLLTNIFIKYMYNSSIESIKNQEIVYEIFKRSCPQLLDVPLFNKEFIQNPIPSIENKIPGKLNYKNLYLVRYFDFIKNFILENFYLINDIVDKEFIVSLDLNKLRNNAKLSQIIYNILQTIIFIKTPNFTSLKKELNIDFDYEDEKFEDTYDEDCISAFVQYNEDIVKLKKENIKLKNQLNTLDSIEKDVEKKSNEYTDLSNALKKFHTARIDIKNFGTENNAVKVLYNSDINSKEYSPLWFKTNNGEGLIIESDQCIIDLKIKCVNDGELKICLRGLDVRDKNNQRIPIYIDYTSLIVNEKNIIKSNKLIWHDQPYIFKKDVENSEIINIHIKWLPFIN